jgi:hypothetical protein
MKGHKEHYKPNPSGLVRDQTYPSQVASQRPKLATRIHCPEGYEETSGEGSLTASPTEDRVAEFNRALRSGHGFRNRGDE